jgi:hypothetical protein
MPSPPLALPYGTAARSADASMQIVLDPVRPLRLNDGQYPFAPPDPAAYPDVPRRLDFLREQLQEQCDLWGKTQRGFLDRYFAWIGERIAAERDELSALLAPFGGLYRPEDFAFSAWRPLPRAHLFAPDRGGAADDPSQWLRVDFAFWSGDAILALDTATERSASQRRRDERLHAAGIVPIALDGGALIDAFPPSMARFWDGERVPRSPFRTNLLGDIEELTK